MNVRRTLAALIAAGAVLALAYADGSTDSDRQKIVCRDIREIAATLQKISRETDQFPYSGERLAPLYALGVAGADGSAPSLPFTDAWGGSYLYWSDGRRYLIASAGPNGVLTAWRPPNGNASTAPLTVEQACAAVATHRHDDLLLVNGKFCGVPPEIAYGVPGRDLTIGERRSISLDQLKTISSALSSYYVDNDAYPVLTRRDAGVGSLEAILAPNYIAQVPTSDAWGNPYLYWSDGDRFLLLTRSKLGERRALKAISGGANVAANLDQWCTHSGPPAADEILIVDGQVCPTVEGMAATR